jgi:hypothetical protein
MTTATRSATSFRAAGYGLLAVAVVIDAVDLDLLTEHAAVRIQLGNRELDTVLHLLAGESHLAGQRPGEADQDPRGDIVGSHKRREGDRSDQEKASPSARHARPPAHWPLSRGQPRSCPNNHAMDSRT